jgi:type II secretory ATPase GspE/PulE/Tfp pilus assembly ATPase PilB-like protein
MGQIIDFYSRQVIDERLNGDFVAYDPQIPIAIEIFFDLDKSVLLEGCWVPLSWDENGIVVLIDDPWNEEKKAIIKTELRTEWVIFKIGTGKDIEAFINRAFNQLEIVDFFSEAISGKKLLDETYLVKTIIADAYLRGVSVIHFESLVSSEKKRVFFRMDGVLREYMTLPGDAANDIVTTSQRSGTSNSSVMVYLNSNLR